MDCRWKGKQKPEEARLMGKWNRDGVGVEGMRSRDLGIVPRMCFVVGGSGIPAGQADITESWI